MAIRRLLSPSPQSSRSTTLALVLLFVVVTGVLAGATRLMRADRAQVTAQLGAEHLDQLDGAARVLQEDLASLREDLAFAGRAVAGPGNDADRELVLSAMRSAVKPCRAVAVYRADGSVDLTVRDPSFAVGDDEGPLRAANRAAAMSALASAPGEITTTLPVRSSRGWFRVFAMQVATASGPRAIALLVDTEPLFGKLELVATPTSRLLLIGPHGGATPVSDPLVVAALARVEKDRAGVEGFAAVAAKLREGARGTQRIEADEAERLGLDRVPMIAAFTSVKSFGDQRWGLATFTSVAALEARERAVVGRVGSAAALIALLLAGFASYLVRGARREAVLRERVMHADELARVHERTEKILDNIPAGVLVIGEGASVTHANRAMRERVGGLPSHAELADALPDAPRAVVDRIQALVDRASEERKVQSLHGERIALFGSEGQYSVHAVPLDSSDSAARAVVVVEDLNEVRSLASQLVRAERLSTVGVLSAGIAHEIGTPLGVARGRAEYVIGKLGEGHAQARSLAVIVDQVDIVARTIRQLLDYARVRPSAVHPVSAAPIARAVGELLRFEADRRKVALEIEVPDSLPLVAANLDELQQALVNLVMNAFDACSPGGHVRIVAERDAAADPSGWRRVRIAVEDDGRGIAPEHRAQVFDPFFTTKKRGQGTGLGLSITAQIVRNHGGQIELHSEPGRGTRVVMLWPAAQEERHAGATA